MNHSDRLETLVGGAQFDVCSYSAGMTGGYSGRSPLRFIYKAALPGGGTTPLFKVLLTNVCVNDCAYCANQSGRDCPRFAFQPDELAKMFMELHAKRLVKGLFLSSGIAGNASRTQEKMINVVEILRQRYEFKGYIHLKILPGAPFDCVEAGCRLADRVSLNMEAPTAHHLARLSSKKNLHQDIVERMRWIKQVMSNNEGVVRSGQTTQFVVGAAGETDRDILHTTSALYNELELRRVYFSAFSPVWRSPLEDFSPTSPHREHRLYQADWLLRVYRFSPQEIELALGEKGNLPITKDPKLLIAQRQPWLFPVDINKASYDELLRVPGIGPVSASRVIEARKDHSIFSLEQLQKMRVVTKRATPFIWFQGMLPAEKQATFLPRFDEEVLPQAPALAGCLP